MKTLHLVRHSLVSPHTHLTGINNNLPLMTLYSFHTGVSLSLRKMILISCNRTPESGNHLSRLTFLTCANYIPGCGQTERSLIIRSPDGPDNIQLLAMPPSDHQPAAPSNWEPNYYTDIISNDFLLEITSN